LDRKTGQVTHYVPGPEDKNTLGKGSDVDTIYKDARGYLWLGGWGSGLDRFDERTGQFKHYRHNPDDPNSLISDNVYKVYGDQSGHIWVGQQHGLSRVDQATEQFTNYRPDPSNPTSYGNNVWVIYQDRSGTLWLGTPGGVLSRFDDKTKTFVNYTPDSRDPHRLNGGGIMAIHEDRAGTLWLGAWDGLYRYNRHDTTFTRYTESQGLPSSTIEGILEDKIGRLWLSTKKGISRFDPQTETFRNYDVSDGLQGDDFSDRCYAQGPDGEMFFGGSNGFNAFFPETIRDDPYVPPIMITGFKIFNKPVAIGANSVLKKAISYVDGLTLSYRDSVFSLEFAALSYANPHKNRYRYKLEGLEPGWNEVGSKQRLATYTNLDAGKYVFRVQGSNSDGVWNEEGVSLPLLITPPWWRTHWFRALSAAVVLALLWAAYQFRVRHLQRESKQLRDVIETIPAYVWSALPDGSVDFINRRWFEFSGFSSGEGLGRGWEAAVHPDDLARFVDQWRATVACGKAMESEARVRTADGQYRWLLIRNVPLHDAAGKIVKWYGTSTDIDDRKRAEETLRKQANLLDLTHDTIFVMDMEGLIKYWNRGAEEQYGWSAEQAVGTVVHDRLKTVFPVPREQLKAEVTRTGRWEGELVHTKKDGSQVVVESRWSLQCDEHGAPVAILETNSDITERKRAEKALRRSEAYLAEGQRLSRTGSWAWSTATGRSTYWSEEMFRIFDLNPEQGVPTAETFWQRVHPQDYHRTYELLQKARLGNIEYRHEHRIVLPNGTVKHIHAIGHPVLGENGQVAEYVGTAMDVTEQKRAKEALQRSEAYLTDAQRLSHTGSWACDGTTRQMLYWSEETFRLWGFDPQQGLPTWEQILQRIQPEDRYELENLPTMLQTGDKEFEVRILLPDGTVKHVQSLVHPVLSPTGGVLEVVGTTVDISERKRAEEERERLRQLEADLAHINRVSMLGELAASIAHEINQPLSGVVSNASASLRWLSREVPDLEEVRQAVHRIVRDGKRAGEVIARIRALTRKDATPREKLDLNEIIREVLVLAGDKVKKEGVQIQTRFANDLAPVSGDRIQLQQVVLNLVVNGIDAMSAVTERPRQLQITTGNIGADQVQVTIEDTGTGLDPNTLEKIFEPFYTTKPGGMGMGLSISRSILHSHGGRLWATAKDGPGTVFHFALTRYQEEGTYAGIGGV
jgi:PAS domain S-box-containing protein